MKLTLNLYPKLTEEHIEKIAYQATQYSFSYNDNGVFPLKSEKTDPGSSVCYTLKIKDEERGIWNLSDHNLIVKRNILLPSTEFLFGNKGIAALSSEIGIAVLWVSKKSDRRGFKIIDSFNAETDRFEKEFSFELEKGSLREEVVLQTIMYLKSPGRIRKYERHLATESGTVLGVLDEYKIILEGSGSIFPIFEVNEPLQPLWWIHTNWVDATIDPFSEEYVKIYINQAHKSYADLNIDEGMKNSPLFIEILSTAIQIIVMKVMEDPMWDRIQSGSGFEKGSVANAVYYFINNFDYNYESAEKLALTIRRDLYSRL